MLNLNGVTNPFNGPDGPLCYNNNFINAYYLHYIQQRHSFASRYGVPLFSYSVLDVAHDNTGRRIQSIDWELSGFVEKMANTENTITIILADHGNTYTTYTHAIMEGRFEQFHPSFFMILPESVKKTLGSQIVDNLRKNQNRLITMLDIHYALVSIPTWNKARNEHLLSLGLFSEISANRTCDELELRLPNLCVCEGWDASVRNTTDQTGILDFAVGELNNLIHQGQRFMKATEERKCQRLVPIDFHGIRERNKDGNLVSSFDFVVHSGHGAKENTDVFHVEVQSTIEPSKQSRDMKLLSFDRISRFGVYRGCRDKSVDKRLCVCDITPREDSKKILDHLSFETMFKPSNHLFPVTITHVNVTGDSCLTLAITSWVDEDETDSKDPIWTASFEVANTCHSLKTTMLSVELNNMKTSRSFPAASKILPYGLTYIGSVMRETPYWASQLEGYNIWTID